MYCIMQLKFELKFCKATLILITVTVKTQKYLVQQKGYRMRAEVKNNFSFLYELAQNKAKNTSHSLQCTLPKRHQIFKPLYLKI